MIKVTGLYYWEEGAHFDRTYYHGEHMQITKGALAPHGLVRLESERCLSLSVPVPGQVIAATSTYFPDLETAQAAMTAAGPVLTADLAKYTSLKPGIHFSEVTAHV